MTNKVIAYRQRQAEQLSSQSVCDDFVGHIARSFRVLLCDRKAVNYAKNSTAKTTILLLHLAAGFLCSIDRTEILITAPTESNEANDVTLAEKICFFHLHPSSLIHSLILRKTASNL